MIEDNSANASVSDQALAFLRSLPLGREIVLWGCFADNDSMIDDGGLSSHDFDVISVPVNILQSAIELDSKKRIGCVVLFAARACQQLDDVLMRRRMRPKRQSPPHIVMLAEEDSGSEVRYLSSGADQVLAPSKNIEAQRLILTALIEDYRRNSELEHELRWRKSAIGQIKQGTFRFYTRREARNLATMLSLTCPEPVAACVGLTELLVNAVEHGCLHIKPGEKEELIESGRFEEEVGRRRVAPEYDGNAVLVKFDSGPDFRRFLIEDPGDGFDHVAHLKKELEFSMAKSGRGVHMARASFTELSYHGEGNIVEAIIRF